MKIIALKFMFFILLSASCAADPHKIDMFIMDYPHGEYRLLVRRTGEAYLFYGEKASAQIIKKDTFSVEELYDIFKPYLYPNLPREEWPDPKLQFGMIIIRYINAEEENYLIFDLQKITEKIFEKAEIHISGTY